MNTVELIEFNRINREAREFVSLATDDYVACRCCLMNGIFSGFRLASEAIEKYIKAFILYKEPPYPVKNYLHDIKKVASAATNLEPSFNPTQHFGDIIDQLELHYHLRYPRDTYPPYSASAAELAQIDELVLYLYESLPIPEVAKFRNDGYFFAVCCPWSPPIHFNPDKDWMQRQNVALDRVRSSLIQRYEAMEKELVDAQ